MSKNYGSIMRFAVIATRDRPKVLQECVDSIYDHVDRIFVVNNGDPDKLKAETNLGLHTIVRHHDEQPPNLSRLWNLGLDEVQSWLGSLLSQDQWNVAILNDDAIVPDGWFDAVGAAMRSAGAAAGCSDPSGNLATTMLHTVPGPVGLQTRMCGWAHMLAGEKGLRYDENLPWWFGDDDMDWRSREAGGMIIIPGYPVVNQFPNGQMTPELQVQAGKDRETFAAKWNGLTPW